MNLSITQHSNNSQVFGNNAGWTVWTTKTPTLQLARTQVQNINFFLTRDIMGKSDEHYAYNPTKIRIVGSSNGL